jgi:hypothetical protein
MLYDTLSGKQAFSRRLARRKPLSTVRVVRKSCVYDSCVSYFLRRRNNSYLCENLAHDFAIAIHTRYSRQTCPVASPVDTRLALYEMKLFESYFELLMVFKRQQFRHLTCPVGFSAVAFDWLLNSVPNSSLGMPWHALASFFRVSAGMPVDSLLFLN